MKRRTFLTGGMVLCSTATFAHTRPPFRLGFLSGRVNHPLAALLVMALRERGWAEERDFVLKIRNSEQDSQRAIRLAKELVERQIDAVVTVNTSHAVAAKQATLTIPIIMYTSGFPVEAGLARSLAQPGGNVTGLSIYAGTGLFGKYVELLREVSPSLRELGVIWDYAPPAYVEREIEVSLGELRRSAAALHINTRVWMVRRDGDVSHALAAAAHSPLDALFVTSGSIHARPTNAPRLTEFARHRRLPMLNDFPGVFEAGGLISYSVDLSELASRTAYFIERIRGGAKPSELPIEQPTRFRLVINARTARAIGHTIPRSLLLRADEIIQ